jgi:branched-chain amino acid transport system ATP-binding protein
LLNIDTISVSYGKMKAVWDVSFDIQEKELVVIVGSNGSGKSTILKTISGLLHPISGLIKFLGERIDHMLPDRIVSMGITHVPEGRRLFPEMTVLENLEIGAYTRSVRRMRNQNIGKVFKYFPLLEKMKNRLAGTLSGGEQQMLAIGRGLMSRPKLLMLDEPSLGLAPMVVVELFEIIKRIHGEGVAVLLVEQNVRHSLKLSDRGYVLDSGRVVMTGKGKELLENEQIKKAYLAA